ncbi:hypothetical protein LOTGIDRAFT_162919 [Lottia gigantea]|uniref:Uncharacterized protein n=1 Tax=Lottia gigantea TaxID=225164 RepID=V4A6B5_LOTGI|nr:hypothetical protein LOTGIDRAFT_162919 [Lottia gigantea]ESO92267.1 hypothetical protein LOTGIDRAFT_162919 [Lottia gigantea]
MDCIRIKKSKKAVGDLKKFSRVDEHHAAYHGYDCHMFTADSRPQCIKDQYTLADVTPAKVLRGADAYRKDGLYSSILFKLWPVFHNEAKLKSPDLSLNRKMPVVSFKKEYKKLKLRDRPKTIAVDNFNLDDQEQNEEGELTPTKTPSTVVIDTSGSTFHRMCSFRESLKFEKGRKRRRTVSGATDHILQEIHTFEKEKRVPGRIQPRSYSFDDLDTEDEPKRDEIMAQYFDEIDAKYEELLEQENLNKEPRYMKFLPCRRTRSLPRCIKPKHTTNETPRNESATTSSFASNMSLSRSVTSMASSRFSRATKRSSIIGNKIKSIAQNISSNISRSRPKSLDLDSLEFNAPEAESSTKAQSTNNISNAASMPDGIMSTASGSEKSIGPGTYYYFESNTLPKAQAKKYDFPWESLPKDWTTAVKLREISKRRPKEERHSSSGHWSASSYSNRHSVESGKSSMPSTYSAYSLGRDSGRDSPSFSDNRTGTSTYKEGNISRDADTESEQYTKLETDQWLKSLALRAASREDVTSSDATTLNSLSRLTRQNILALDMQSPDLKQPKLDDEFSEFSVDQDGFFTSFHTDSGLRHSNGNLAGEDDLSPTKENLNLFGMGSSNTIDSVIFRPTSGPGQSLGPGKRTVLKRVSGKLPPPTPRRTCSITNVSVPISESTFEIGNGSPAVSDGSNSSLSTSGKQCYDSSFSESDQETIYARLKLKTQISTSLAYPSWCSVSPSDSGEEIRESPKSQPESPEILEFDTIPEEESEKVKSKCAHNHSGNTLPRTRKYLSKKNWEEDTGDQSNSWPRSQKSGILKSEQSDSSKMSKTLNFDPVVNAYDSTNSESYQLTIPFMDDNSTSNQKPSTIPIKYQPTITVTPKGRQDESSRSTSADSRPQVIHYRKNISTSTPTNHYAVSNLKGFPIRAPSEISASSLSISSLCENDGGYMDMSQGLKQRSNDNLSSTSSLALSDIDNSITYVSMSSPFSTPTNSTLTLNENDGMSKVSARPTDTYRVSSALIAAAAGVELNSKDINSNSIKSDSGTLKRERRNSKPNLTSQLSAPVSPAVVIVNNSQGHLPHSESWPTTSHSSTYTGQSQDTSLNSSRSDSYRVAMRTDANELTNPHSKSREVDQSSLKRKSTGSVKSTSSSPRTPATPVTPEPDPNVIRADSYRIAVRKTNGVVAPFDAMGRATSYSVAMRDSVPGNDNPLARNSTSSLPDGKKDSRRRGITDIDQLKDYSGDRKFSLKSASNLFATINSSKKKMNVKSEIESLLRPTTSPSPESNRSSKSPKSPKSPKADKSKNKEHRSSTYIRFDPIFEDKEDFLSSRDSLRTNSMSSLNKSVSEATGSRQKLNVENDPLLGAKLSQPLPVQRSSRSSLSGRKVVDDKAVTSILDSIKSTIKSMSNKKTDSESEMRLATDV